MRYFLELSYNGAAYRGWQRQNDAPTVQATLEDVLSRLFGASTTVTGAGRTDTGVHAARYVAHFDYRGGRKSHGAELDDIASDEAWTDEDCAGDECAEDGRAGDERVEDERAEELGADFLYHANAMLPPDIALMSVRRVADDAHARFDAREREYTYQLLPFKDPFRAGLAWYYSVPLDVEAMNRAAAHLLTVGDFTTFAKLGGGNKTNLCRVTRAEWRREADGELVFTIRADRFLRNMVRAVVGTLVDVGRGKMTPERFAAIVDARDLSMASGGAPAHGLFLTDIKYELGNLKI
jgi:tRNA pseudouridine38-40 synthase